MLASFVGLSSRSLWRHAARSVSISAYRRAVEIETEREFQEKVIRSDIPVIVDFYAHWCGPCRSLTPLLEDVASESGGKIELAKVNVDVLPDLALQYQVSAIPAVAGLKGGKVVDQFVGLKDAHFLKKFAQNLVSH